MPAKVCATYPYPKPLTNSTIADAYQSQVHVNDSSWSPWSGQTIWNQEHIDEAFQDAVELNGLLRSHAALSDDAIEKTAVFDSMMEETLEVPEGFVMFSPVKGINPSALEPGTILRDQGYLNGFTDANVLPDFKAVKVVVPEGTQLGKFTDAVGEHTFVLPRESDLRVLGVDGQGHLNLEVMPQEHSNVVTNDIFMKSPTKQLSAASGHFDVVGIPAAAQKKAAKLAGLDPSKFKKPDLPTLPGGAAPAINVIDKPVPIPTIELAKGARRRSVTKAQVGEFGPPTSVGAQQLKELWAGRTAGQQKETLERSIARGLVKNQEDADFWYDALNMKDRRKYIRPGVDPKKRLGGHTSIERTDIAAIQEAVYDDVRGWIDTWAMTSADDHIHALLMQKAAAIEFDMGKAAIRDIDALIKEKLPKMKARNIQDALSKSPYARQRGLTALAKKEADYLEEYQLFLREMYDQTQAVFKSMGVTHVTLFRGMSVRTNSLYDTRQEFVKAVKELGMVSEREISLRPLSSFSFSKRTAEGFTGHNTWFSGSWENGKLETLIECDVPIQNIIGSALTGFGCLNEKEIVVMPAKGVVRMTIRNVGVAGL